MNSDKIKADEIIFYALGFTGSAESAKLKQKINHLPAEVKQEISEYNRLVSLFPKLISDRYEDLSIPDNIKSGIMNSVMNRLNTDSEITDESFKFIYSDSANWIQHSVKGIEVKQLSINENKGYVTFLMKAAPGTTYPAHHHNGSEECYVIEGDVIAEGKILGPGDFHHAEAGSNHSPLYTKNGCLLLLVIDKEDY